LPSGEIPATVSLVETMLGTIAKAFRKAFAKPCGPASNPGSKALSCEIEHVSAR
jgi:hypothetical protein